MLRQEAIGILKGLISIVQDGDYDDYMIIECLDEAIGLLERADEIECL